MVLIHPPLSLARRLGAFSVISHVRKRNTAAIKLYENAGFQRESDNYLNSYGDVRHGRGWQYRVRLPAEGPAAMVEPS